MMVFEKVCDCTNCPCLNSDRDESVCNLRYYLDFRYMENNELIYSSTSCELISINFGNKVFKPEFVYATKKGLPDGNLIIKILKSLQAYYCQGLTGKIPQRPQDRRKKKIHSTACVKTTKIRKK